MKIKKLTLFTSNLPGQIDFYSNTLEFKVLVQGKGFAEFKTGDSVLRFEEQEAVTPYHFAFNIPSFQEVDALEWLKQRLDILPFESDDIILFEAWNAHAIYFYDKDKNIVEFIARKNLGYASDTPFSSGSILCISEVGVPVDDIVPVHEHLSKELELPVYSGSTDRFCAIGDEHGLFIVLNKNVKKTWFPTDDLPLPSNFKVTLSNNEQWYGLTFHQQNLFTHELKSNHHSFKEFA